MERRALDLSFYVSVGLIAGAIIALQIGIMRVFAVGTWSHFGSFVISIAMLGFGVMSAAMCVSTPAFRKYWEPLITGALIVFGPLMLLSNAVAQSLGFNPIELVANPEQKFRLFYLFPRLFHPLPAGRPVPRPRFPARPGGVREGLLSPTSPAPACAGWSSSPAFMSCRRTGSC